MAVPVVGVDAMATEVGVPPVMLSGTGVAAALYATVSVPLLVTGGLSSTTML